MNETKEADLISVLRNLGFKVKEAKQRTDAVLQAQVSEVPLEHLIKEAVAWTTAKSESGAIQGSGSSIPEDSIDEPHPLTVLRAKAADEPTTGESTWLWILTPMALMGLLILWLGTVKALLILGGLVFFVYLLGRSGSEEGSAT
jgi:hypothetical protein